MKNSKYIKRLLLFAEHLKTADPYPAQIHRVANIVELEENVNIHYTLKYDFLVIDELPGVFSEWYYNKKNGEQYTEK